MLKENSNGSSCLDHQPNSANSSGSRKSSESLSIVTVVLPEALIKKLDAFAKRRAWKRSEALAHAVSNFINAQSDVA